MVTLASPIISCTVRELTDGGVTTVTYNAVTDFGAVGDGATSNATITAGAGEGGSDDIQSVLSAIDSSKNVRLYWPAGTYYEVGAGYAYYIKNIHILGDPPIAGVWQTQLRPVGGEGNMHVMIGGTTPYLTLLRSARFDSAAQGATVLQIKNRDISQTGRTLAQIVDSFTVGSIVCTSEYDLQTIGYPPNNYYFQYNTVVAKDTVAGTITLSTPLERAYSDETPEYNPGDASYKFDQGGPATLWMMYDYHDYTGTYENIQVLGGGVTASGGNSVLVKNCKFTNFPPSSSQNIQFDDCIFTLETELDKFLTRVEFNRCEIASLSIQSSPITVVVNDSTITGCTGITRDFTCNNSEFTSSISFTAGNLGQYDVASFTDTIFPSTISVPSVGNYSLVGCEFVDGTIKGVSFLTEASTGTATVGQTITGATSGATGVIRSLPAANTIMVDTVSGIFERREIVTTATFSATYLWPVFGFGWAIPGAKIHLDTANCPRAFSATVVRAYEDPPYICVETDAVSFPSYSDGPFIKVGGNPCPNFTVTNCTGHDWALAWSQAPSPIQFGSWTKYWLKSNGLISSPPPIWGKFKSMTVNVTTAYTGTSPNLYLAFAQYGINGLQLPAGTFASENFVRVDLKTTGTRVFATAGNSGVQASDHSGDLAFLMTPFTPKLLTTKTGNTLIDISGESSSVWPAFTVTMEAETEY
jgi:hypothetical protein